MVTCKSRRGIPLEQPELAEHKLNSKVITVLAFACHVLSPKILNQGFQSLPKAGWSITLLLLN